MATITDTATTTHPADEPTYNVYRLGSAGSIIECAVFTDRDAAYAFFATCDKHDWSGVHFNTHRPN